MAEKYGDPGPSSPHNTAVSRSDYLKHQDINLQSSRRISKVGGRQCGWWEVHGLELGEKNYSAMKGWNSFCGEKKERKREGLSMALSSHKRKTFLDHGLGSEKN